MTGDFVIYKKTIEMMDDPLQYMILMINCINEESIIDNNLLYKFNAIKYYINSINIKPLKKFDPFIISDFCNIIYKIVENTNNYF
jgi:hypothetical protein